jgi:hypothetical protein
MSTEYRDWTNEISATGQGQPIMSDEEFADLGAGEWAYIRALSSQQAKVAFPTVDDLPEDLELYALLAADGTPLVLTDDEGTAISHAISDDLELAQLH